MKHFWKRPSTPSQSTSTNKSEMQLLTSMTSMSSIERKELLNILVNKSKARKDAKANVNGRKRVYEVMGVNALTNRPMKRGRSADGTQLQLVICDFSADDLAKLRQTSPSTTVTPIDNQALQSFRVPVQTLSPTDAVARACLDTICASAKNVSKIPTAPTTSVLPKVPDSKGLALSLSSMVYDEWKAKAANSLKQAAIAPEIPPALSIAPLDLDLSIGDSSFDAVGPLALDFSW